MLLFWVSFRDGLFVVDKRTTVQKFNWQSPSPFVTAKRKICHSFGKSNPGLSAIIQSIQWKCSPNSED